MQTYPVRASIYCPQMVFGLRLSNWPWVFGLTLVALAVPFFGGWSLGPIPVTVLAGPLALGGSVMFFKWAEAGRRPRWLENKMEALNRTHHLVRRRHGARQHKTVVSDK